MAKDDDAKRQKVLVFLSGRLSEAATLAEAKPDAACRSRVFAEHLGGLGPRLERLHPQTHSDLFDVIATALGTLADILPQLTCEAGTRRRVEQGDALDAALKRLRQAFRACALSTSPVAMGSRDKPDGRKAKLNEHILAVRADASALACGYHQAVLDVRDAIGLPETMDGESFGVPPAGQSRSGPCGSSIPRVIREDAPLPGQGRAPEVPSRKLNERQLLLVAGQLDELTLLTALFFNRLATLLREPIFLSYASNALCIDTCDPVGIVQVRAYQYGSQRVGTQYFPTMGFSWVRCCACPCYYVFTEQREINTIHMNLKVLHAHASSSAATRAAMQRAEALALAYNRSLGGNGSFSTPQDVVPAFKPPACDCVEF